MRFRSIAASSALLLLIAACGDVDDEADLPATPSPASVTTGSAGPPSSTVAESSSTSTTASPTSTTADAVAAERIVVLNGDLAEVVWALGAGGSVVATDISATYPPEAASSPKIGYQRTLNVEGILSFEPTLVLGNDEAGPPEVLTQLRDAGVPVEILEYGSEIPAVGEKIRLVAEALGVPDEGEALATDTEAAMAEAVAAAEGYTGHPSGVFLYFRGADVQLIGGAGAGSDSIFSAIGVRDVATEAGIADIVPLTPEALVELEPDVIVVTTAGVESVGGLDGLLAVPGVAETPAGRDRRILAYDDQQLLGFGPRLPELLGELIVHVHEGTTYDELVAATGGTTDGGSAGGDGAEVDPTVVAAWDLVFNDLDAAGADRSAALGDQALAGDLDRYTALAGDFGIELLVTGVVVAGDTATVTYDALLGGNAVATDLSAPMEGGPDAWVVPRKTFCAVLALARTSCEG